MKRSLRIARKIVRRILDNGLKNSTWKYNNEGAYDELLEYRADMEMNVANVLEEEIADEHR